MAWVYSHVHQRTLLRVAPYANLDRVKEELVATCTDRLDNGYIHTGYIERYREHIQQFVDGKLPTLPDAGVFRETIYEVLPGLYGDTFLRDALTDDAVDHIVSYFFNTVNWYEEKEDV